MRTIRVLTHFLKIFYNKGALEPCVDILQMAGARPSFGLVWDTALNPRPRSGIRKQYTASVDGALRSSM